ncbi:MAG: hypothetical protein ABL951_04615, partial [Alphaproteobacteria bacterium]
MLRSEKDKFASLTHPIRHRQNRFDFTDLALVQTGSLVLPAALCLFLLAPGLALGATFRITPTADISESYTDNVQSVSEGAESDLITQTQVGANFAANGARLNLNLNISAVHDYYLESDGLNGIRPRALGSGDVELWQDHFFINSSVSMSETSTQRNGARSATDRSLPSNRTQLLLYDFSPRLVGHLGRLLEATLQYSHSESRFSKPASGVTTALPITPVTLPITANPNLFRNQGRDQKSDDYSLSLDTGRYFTSFSSQLIFEKSTTKSPGSQKETDDRVDLVNEYQITRQVALIARAGYEDVGSGDSSLASSGATGAFGVHLKPGPKVDFRTEYGRRFGDPNLSADLTYRISSFYTLNASYEQSIETQNSTRLNQLNRLTVAPDGRLVDPFSGSARDPSQSSFDLSNAAFRQNLFQMGLSGAFGRNTINLGADLTSRESAQRASKE